MSDPLDELDEILDASEAAEAERARQAQVEDQDREAWALEFGRWVDSVVTPALEPLAGRLRERGHEVTFSTDRERGHREPNPKPHELEMSVGGDFGTRKATVKILREEDRVVTIQTNAGANGTRLSKGIDLVTVEMLQEAALSSLRSAFAR